MAGLHREWITKRHILYVEILEGENFDEPLLMKQMVRKILANLLAGLQLIHCTPFAKFAKILPLQNFSMYSSFNVLTHGSYCS